MTVVTLHMPRLGETMEQGTVADWLVSTGEHFERGALLVEFETDKTAVELPALGPGRLVKWLVEPGDIVRLGEPVAEIELDGENDWVSATAAATESDREDGEEARHNETGETELTDATVDRGTVAARSPLPNTLVRATPPARLAAWRAGLKMDHISGTGRRGRIELSDVEKFRLPQDAARLASEQRGPGDGIGVILVHGFAGDMTTFDQLGRSLGRSGMAVRAVDLPGHGQTHIEAATFDQLVDGLAGELVATGPVNVVAHSLGAAAAVKAAAHVHGQIASLTLIAPAGLGHAIDGDFITGMALPGSVGETAHLLRRLSGRADHFSEQIVRDIYSTLCRGRLVSLAADIACGDHQLVSVVRELAELAGKIPVHVLVGHRDRILDWQEVLAVSPNIGVHHFPEAGHMPHWDFPAEVSGLLERIMSREE